MKYFSLSFLIILCFFTLMSGCANSGGEANFVAPKFKVSNEAVNSEIQYIIKTQKVHIEEISLPDNGNIVSGVGIQLINLEEKISNDSVVNVQKRVAIKVKSLLVNPSEYKSYGVIFLEADTVRSAGGIQIKERGYSSNHFSSESL